MKWLKGANRWRRRETRILVVSTSYQIHRCQIIMEPGKLYSYHFKSKQESSGQDGGIGRNPSLPCTTKRRVTTNLKSINNKKCQKIKLHGALKTKELKKQSNRKSRLVRRDKEMWPK